MSGVSKGAVLEALGTVVGPDAKGGIVRAGMVSDIVVRGAHVSFAIEVDPSHGAAMEPVRRRAEEAVLALKHVTSVSAVLTAHRNAPAQSREKKPAPRKDLPLAPGIKAILAVASGKGGVGKSTLAVNLALGLSQLNLAVGVLDADIYGPSMPRMLGVSGRPNSPDGKRLEPMEAHGLKVMSIGFLVPEDTAMIWRGPMVMSALEQMLRDVEWGTLDILVVDMPPGTGDAQLTIAQRVPLVGAVIVSTPQDIALLDARRGLNMFTKVEVPVFGIVENMSYFHCPKCGERTEIFGHNGAREEAARLGCEFLGEVALDAAIRISCDEGTPFIKAKPDSVHAAAYLAIAKRVAEKIEQTNGAPTPPRIAME